MRRNVFPMAMGLSLLVGAWAGSGRYQIAAAQDPFQGRSDFQSPDSNQPSPPPPGADAAVFDGADPDARPEDEQFEVLGRGPVHEAFAIQPITDPQPEPVIPKEPPPPIDEVPPEVQPEGDNVTWIPGYYEWSEDHDDFVWVSGCWRDIPPGQRWVPGYWQQADGGFQWTSGFWLSAEVQELNYLSAPPASLEQGPSNPSPGDDHFYVPGSWEPADNTYAWRPGYWAPYQTNYVWQPACYNYTPRGYVYNAGYWDYQLANRGLLFAPIYARRGWGGIGGGIGFGGGYRYSPYATIPFSLLQFHMFGRIGSPHYAFGNYYGGGFGNRYRPWYAPVYRGGGGGIGNVFNPMFGYYNWQYGRGGVNYYNRLSSWNQFYSGNPNYRPPVNYAQQRQLAQQLRNNPSLRDFPNAGMTVTNVNVLINQNSGNKFVTLNANQRTQITNRAQELRALTDARIKAEARADGPRPNLAVRGDANNRRVEVLGKGVALPRTEAAKPRVQLPKSPGELARTGAGDRVRAGKPVVPGENPGAGARDDDRPRPGAPGAGARDDDPPRPGVPAVNPGAPGTGARDDDRPRPGVPAVNPGAPGAGARDGDRPRPSVPGATAPKGDTPRIPRVDTPRADGPRPAPGAQAPKSGSPRPAPGAQAPKSGSPRPAPGAQAPKSSSPRPAAPRAETPRAAPPRATPAPRAPGPQMNTPRPATRVETPRAAPARPATRAPSATPPRVGPPAGGGGRPPAATGGGSRPPSAIRSSGGSRPPAAVRSGGGSRPPAASRGGGGRPSGGGGRGGPGPGR